LEICPDIYAHALGPAALRLGHKYIRQILRGHGITITYNPVITNLLTIRKEMGVGSPYK